MNTTFAWLILAHTLLYSLTSQALEVLDHSGRTVVLDKPAERIISLAPHTTELLFEIGAGDKVIAVAEYSDYPPAARRLPRVSNHNSINLESILSMQPDLIIALQSGSHMLPLKQLSRFGIPVYFSEPLLLTDIPKDMTNFGMLTGMEKTANRIAQTFQYRLRNLADKYSTKKPIRVFYELWHQPIMSINGQQLISRIIRLCGGENIFSQLEISAPIISVEAVISANPDVIIGSTIDIHQPDWLNRWKKWPELTAVKGNQLYAISSDLLHRQSSRILEGVQLVCEKLERARINRYGPSAKAHHRLQPVD